MKVNELFEALEDYRISRVSLYLSEIRINQLFRNKVARINKIITSEEIGPEFSAGLSGFLGIKISGKKGISHDLDISLDEKALLIEVFEKDRGNLYTVDDINIPKGALMSFVGESQITLDTQDVTPETSILPQKLAQAIQEKREKQAKGSKEGTMLWSSKSGKYITSICYMESIVDPGIAYSYFRGRYGILGTKEDESEDLLTISPRWIWYEQEYINP